jgi:hypothetical protein
MIEPLSDLPDGVIGFRFSGHVSKDEYRSVLLPALKEHIDRGDKIRAVSTDARSESPHAISRNGKATTAALSRIPQRIPFACYESAPLSMGSGDLLLESRLNRREKRAPHRRDWRRLRSLRSRRAV